MKPPRGRLFSCAFDTMLANYVAGQLPGWVVLAVLIVGGLALAVVAVLAWWLSRRTAAKPAALPETEPEPLK